MPINGFLPKLKQLCLKTTSEFCFAFLGAGMIIFKKDSHDVGGLTTAAGIVTTAAIGILVGLERYFLAVGSTAIVFVVLRFVNIFEVKVLDPDDKTAESETSETRKEQ